MAGAGRTWPKTTAQGRAQHGSAVGVARIRSRARAFELQVPSLPRTVDDLTERDGAAISQLPCPLTELMSAVVRRIRFHPFDQRVPAEGDDDPHGTPSNAYEDRIASQIALAGRSDGLAHECG